MEVRMRKIGFIIHPVLFCLITGLLLPAVVTAPAACAAEKAEEASVEDLLKTAYEHKQHGRYEEAREIYAVVEQKLEQESPKNSDAQWKLIKGLMQIDLETGDTKAAFHRLESGLKQDAQRPELQAWAAQMYYEAGQYPEAEKHVARALALDADQPRAHLIQAHLLTEAGKIDEANEAYRWFVRYYNRAQPEDAETLLVIAEGATQYARWNSVSQIFNFVVNTLCPDALKADPLAWEASYLGGLILQEKYNRPQSGEEFQAALKTNSQAAPVYVALARTALEIREFDQSSELLERALKINPRLLEGLLLKCDLEIINGQYKDALKTVAAAEKINARSQLVLARKAACFLLLDGVPAPEDLKPYFDESETVEKAAENKSRFSQLLTKLLAQNPKPGYFLFEVGNLLEAKRQFAFAEFAYLKTKALMPQLSGPLTSLGMLYMAMGRTDQAQQTLNEAFSADPYHVRVSNMRKVLGVLESYGSIVTDHFVIRYDSKADYILGQYMADYLEEIYPEMVKQFGYQPPGKTQFEIYHDAKGLSAHQWFSARMIGLPWIQTIGASTGAVVALTSPTAMKEPYNWASVLKHELVHVFTLQQTKYKIPHWFTEALAVRSEGAARPQRFNQLLVERVPKNEIYGLDELDGVFVRPKSSSNWDFAYCQSLLCADFMVAEFGDDALKKLLLSYQKQGSTATAIQECFGISQEEFEKRYHAYLHKIADSLKGYPQEESALGFRDLQKQYEANQDDPDLAGRYAYRLLRLRKKADARKIAQAALKKKPAQAQAALTIAQLELLSEDLDSALAVLQAPLKSKTPDVEVLSLAGKLLLKQSEFDKALPVYQKGHATYPYQTEWLQGLSIIYQQEKNLKAMEETHLKLVHLDPADEESMKLLMEGYRKQGKLAEALRWGEAALQVDVLDPETHLALAQIALKLDRKKLAIRELKMLLHLQEDNAHLRYLLAQTLLEDGQPEAARTELELLLKQNPDHADALKLKQKL
ncbi:tetratricopeptide repeat protein [Gimesia panareensis]|uniref:Tetratricopeptide repeat protein n=2 Tax=Gimesia panareensis TaxID=2527978 RepID=A0A518FQU1_9PLAN|nr:tetratricopeptide repeat protein [Gimesia panareensis]